MAKMLGTVCEGVRIDRVVIRRTRKPIVIGTGPEGVNLERYQTLCVVHGECLKADGTPILREGFRIEIPVGEDADVIWTPEELEKDMKRATILAKQKFKDLAKDKADLDL